MMRNATISRTTKETDINLTLDLAGETRDIKSSVPFLDHMLDLLAFHGGFGLTLTCKGDNEIDDHHSVEDIGIALGEAFKKALGDKVGINRYGSMLLPMDESLARVTLDISNRPYLVYNVPLTTDKLGTFDTQNVKEFLRAFAFNAGITLHVELLYGDNDHHKVEAIFKALARALKEAIEIKGSNVTSSKGVL